MGSLILHKSLGSSGAACFRGPAGRAKATGRRRPEELHPHQIRGKCDADMGV